jgi:hypothetical protein
MFKTKARRAGLAALAAAVAVTIPTGIAHADGSIGSISGHFTSSTGDPIANGYVSALDPDSWNWIGGAQTDDSGAYSIPDLPAGDYLVQFNNPNGLVEYAPETSQSWQAGHFAVTAGQDTTVDERALAAGTLSGTLLDADGKPAPGIQIYASDNNGNWGFANTDDAGAWSTPVFADTGYTITETLPSGLRQYAPAQAKSSAAGMYDVADGQTVTVDDRIQPTGTISGRFTDENGGPEASAQVSVDFTDNESSNWGTADDHGDYSVQVFAGGPYRVSLTGSDQRTQWAYGSLDADHAATFTVDAGADVVVDDAHIATGSVTVTAKDATTGAAVASFCANADNVYACTTGGTVTLTDVRVGAQDVSVYPTSTKYMYVNSQKVTVVAGQTATATFSLQLGATIKTTIVDSTTGLPVEGACVLAFVPGETTWPDSVGTCSGADGVVRVSRLNPGSYKLFVNPPDQSTYGAQWVGTSAGTGIESSAKVVTTSAGHTTVPSNIKLDRAGTITGVITGVGSATPLAGASVGPNTFTPGVGAAGNIVRADDQGRYTVTNLGPYAWPLWVSHEGYASQWTGGVGNRNLATTIAVHSGQTTNADITMKRGTAVTGVALKGDGTPITEGGYIVVHNANTGDVMGFTWANPDGTFSVPLIPGQNIKIEYWFDEDQTRYFNWVGGTDQATAQSIKVTSPGQFLQIVLQASAQ